MARNRMIKPDFWDDEKLALISKPSRLVFIGMWNFSDDYGVVKGNSIWLKNHIFPYENNSMKDFNGWIDELKNKGLIFLFQQSDENYFYIKNFTKHQTINRPSKQRNPEPPHYIIEYSRHTHDTLTDEVKLKEVKLKEKKSTKFPNESLPYKLPSKEEINESAQPKLIKDLNKICDELYEKKIFPKVHAFKNKMFKEGKNERAIIHTLTRCYLKKIFKDSPWAYCEKIISIEDGNYNERDYLKTVPESDSRI